MEHIKKSFDEKANNYDSWIERVCPFYKEAIETLIMYIPQTVHFILDLGCGTGNISKAIFQQHPHVDLTLVDIAPHMLAEAKKKFGDNDKVHFFEKDMCHFTSRYTFDVVVASLSVHHLETKEKERLFESVLKLLVPGGHFFLLEQVVLPTGHKEKICNDEWIMCMKKNGLPDSQIAEVFARKASHDKCETLVKHIEMMRKSGFVGLDVLYRKNNISLFCGEKY
jgi:tRNA (cmo5U34)-methyltransferase